MFWSRPSQITHAHNTQRKLNDVILSGDVAFLPFFYSGRFSWRIPAPKRSSAVGRNGKVNSGSAVRLDGSYVCVSGGKTSGRQVYWARGHPTESLSARERGRGRGMGKRRVERFKEE